RRFVHAVAVGDVGAHVRFACAYVNHLGICRRDGNGSDRSDRLRIEDGIPGAARVVGAPDAAARSAKVIDIWLAAYSGDGQASPSTKGADGTPTQIWENSRIEGRGSIRRTE